MLTFSFTLTFFLNFTPCGGPPPIHDHMGAFLGEGKAGGGDPGLVRTGKPYLEVCGALSSDAGR